MALLRHLLSTAMTTLLGKPHTYSKSQDVIVLLFLYCTLLCPSLIPPPFLPGTLPSSWVKERLGPNTSFCETMPSNAACLCLLSSAASLLSWQQQAVQELKVQRLLAGATMESSHSEDSAAADDGTQAMQAVLATEASGNVCGPHDGQSVTLPLPAVPRNSGFWHLCSHLLFIRKTQHFGVDATQAPCSLFA